VLPAPLDVLHFRITPGPVVHHLPAVRLEHVAILPACVARLDIVTLGALVDVWFDRCAGIELEDAVLAVADAGTLARGDRRRIPDIDAGDRALRTMKRKTASSPSGAT
jgi:hypothetical protein